MSKQALDEFLATVESDPVLQAKLKETDDLPAIESIANARGFSVTRADLLGREPQGVGHLSDAELESVAGGADDEWKGRDSKPTNCGIECVPQAIVSLLLRCKGAQHW